MENWREILEDHFVSCLRYWERTLNVDSDLSNKVYLHAIKEIPHRNPFSPCGDVIPEDIRNAFVKEKLMNCYGREWEKHLSEVM